MTSVADRPHRTPIWLVACLTLGSSLFVALLLVRPFGFQPFNVPLGAMQPTLLIGDYFFVSKYAYGYSRYSLPFSLPLFSGRIFGAQPRYGDVVVYPTRETRRSITSNVLSDSSAIASR
jgi:signal peptidase I